MNFRNPTATDNFTSLATLAATAASSTPPTPQHSPDAPTPLVTALRASADDTTTRADMSEAEVAAPPRVLNLTGDTQVIEDSHIGANTRKNYTCTLVSFMFWVL